MYDHDYYAKMDKAMVRVLKAVARSVGYGFTGLLAEFVFQQTLKRKFVFACHVGKQICEEF